VTYDLSAVTDSLIGLVKNQWSSAPLWTEVSGPPPSPTFTPNFSGLAPDAVLKEAGPQLSLYLYHVETNNAQEALFWQPQMMDDTGGEPTRLLPLALDLYYLLFAWSESSYIEEQEAMSIAMRIYHANPIVRSGAGAAVPWELCLTVEHRSYDELSRLWQATTAPLRMSVVYRAAVAFIEPDTGPESANLVTEYFVNTSLSVLFGTSRLVTYVGPSGQPTSATASPATVAPSQTVTVLGTDLGIVQTSDHVYLLPPGGGAEVDVTAWVDSGASDLTQYVLTLPATVGAPPGDSPPPGHYQLRVGSNTVDQPRSAVIPLDIAPFVEPAGGPVLAGAAPFTIDGAGFVTAATDVSVGSTALTASPTPGAGEFDVDPSGNFLTFSPPAGPSGSVEPIQVSVNGVSADPAWWVTL
jgi:hypothetical protein